jgi:hypothetical protein
MPDPIVEACIIDGAKVKARLQVNLAYATDVAIKDKAHASGIGPMGIDAGGGEAGDAGETPVGIGEDNITSQIEYGQLCEHELGRIVLSMIREGEYEDVRLLRSVANGSAAHVIRASRAGIPATIDGRPTENAARCELGPDSVATSASTKRPRNVSRAAEQPSPKVMTAKNDMGALGAPLPQVADDGKG